MKIKKAIITAAGSGTRFLPASKAQSKEMLPILNKPTIQYPVEELAATGVEDIIIVTGPNSLAVENHFDSNLKLESELRQGKKTKQLREVQSISRLANFIFLRQKSFHTYGNATPLLLSQSLVKDEPFFYIFGDDVTVSDKPVCQQLVEMYEQNPDAAAIIAVQKIPRREVGAYGVVKIKKGTKNELEKIVEKPDPAKSPSNLAVLGRYLFTPKILPHIKKLKKGKSGELWLVDAVIELLKKEKILVCEIEGKWMTTGDPINMFQASLEIAKRDPELKKKIQREIKKAGF